MKCLQPFKSLYQWLPLLLVGMLLMLPLLSYAEGEDDPLWNRPSYEKKVSRVGRRILAANGIHENIAFLVHHDRNEVNASATDFSSTVWVEQGLLNLIESDDELAAVLGHEIAHIMYRHPTKSVVGQNVMSFLIRVPLIAVTPPGMERGVGRISDKMAGAVSRPVNQISELQADAKGLELMAGAGYDPLAMETLLSKISGDGASVWALWRSHPMGTHRIQAVHSLIKSKYPNALKTPYSQQSPVQTVQQPKSKSDEPNVMLMQAEQSPEAIVPSVENSVPGK